MNVYGLCTTDNTLNGTEPLVLTHPFLPSILLPGPLPPPLSLGPEFPFEFDPAVQLVVELHRPVVIGRRLGEQLSQQGLEGRLGSRVAHVDG